MEPMLRSRMKDLGYLVKSLVAHRPFLIERDASTAMMQRIEALARTQPAFDAVHADQLWMAPYALHFCKVAAQQGKRPLCILDQHNAVFMIPQRMADAERFSLKRALMQLEAHKLASFEVETCRRFDSVTWVTREDYVAVQAEARRRGLDVPNDGVLPICGDPESIAPIVRSANARRVTFLGGLHYPPNAQGVLWFAREIFPLVLREAPDAVFTVIGKQPPEELASLDIPPGNLDVTGYVGDPTPYLKETGAFVVPLLAGGGMRVKIIDAWTWGLPVVSTSIGAEGVEAVPGKNIILADEPISFVRAVLNLLSDPQLNERIGCGGRHTALERYNWRVVYRRWDRIYSSGSQAHKTAQEL